MVRIEYRLFDLLQLPDFDQLPPAQQVKIRRDPAMLAAQRNLHNGRYIFAPPLLNALIETLIVMGYLVDSEVYE
jgi:hypothetical protein